MSAYTLLRRLTPILLAITLLIPAEGAFAREVSPAGWTDRLVITYASGPRSSLPAGVDSVLRSGRREVVDLGRRAVPSDLRRFSDPSILAVEPDLRISPATITPNDPSYGSQWDMSDAGRGAADYSVKAPGAWDLTVGSAAITIAVIDTGITTHSEFSGRLVSGYDFIYDLDMANDGDRRDSDPSDPGDGCGGGRSSWHGTHVAGTIGATGNNNEGIAGLNWVSKIQPIRVLGECGGYLFDVADAIRWAAGDTVSGVPSNATPARVINLSLGGGGSCPDYLQSAIDTARGLGALVVVAAGNSNQNVSDFTPANCSGVIAVGATGRNGKRAYYSNYGSSVTVAAPGGNFNSDSGIYSTLNAGAQAPTTESYAAYQGTSMAAPHVAGVLSLLLSLYPSLTESEILALITETSTPFPVDTGSSPCSTAGNCGAGIINAAALLAAATPDLVSQTITLPDQVDRYLGESAFNPGATATSGLPVSYETSTPPVCTTNGTLISLVSVGTCEITAVQAGDASYLAADPVGKSVTVLVRATPAVLTDVAFAAPSLSPLVGTEVSVELGTWSGDPAPSLSYRWYQCSSAGSAVTSTRVPSGCKLINGATAVTYNPTGSNLGKRLRIATTATNVAEPRGVTRFSATSLPVVSAPIMKSAPSISGTPSVGRSVSVRKGSFTGTASITYAYAWYSCSEATSASTELDRVKCSETVLASTSRYTPDATQRGRLLVMQVTATNTYGSVTYFTASSAAVR